MLVQRCHEQIIYQVDCLLIIAVLNCVLTSVNIGKLAQEIPMHLGMQTTHKLRLLLTIQGINQLLIYLLFEVIAANWRVNQVLLVVNDHLILEFLVVILAGFHYFLCAAGIYLAVLFVVT